MSSPKSDGTRSRSSAPPPSPKWPRYLLLLGLLVGVFLLVQKYPRGSTERPVSRAYRHVRMDDGPASPGEIETHKIELRLPPTHVFGYDCPRNIEGWYFRGSNPDGVIAMMRAAGVGEAELARVPGLTRCDPSGCTVMPDVPLIESMSRDVRTALYRQLNRFPENRVQVYPFVRSMEFGSWGSMTSFAPHARELIERGTWIFEGHFAFSDLQWLCSSLNTDAERLDATTMLRTREGLDAWVRVPATGDLQPLIRYWTWGGDVDVQKLFTDARRGDGRVPLVSLMPPMARVRLNQFSLVGGLEYDCYWTAVNFFENEPHTDRLPALEGFAAFVRENYAEIPLTDVQFGDLLTFVQQDGAFAHVAVMLTKNIVFTKNGRPHSRPWVFMSLDDVRLSYPNHAQRAYRHR